MGKKYDSFIELTPGYESVVDISSDNNNADFWSRYIVNEDMVRAVELLSRSLRPDDPNEDVWHYWITGSYGTGKTYSAIVIKHLLEDDFSTVENFLSKNKLFIDTKDKYLSARKKGKYYVKFRSGECKQLNSSNKLLFQIEKTIREILLENDFKYSGSNSLIDSVKKTVKQFSASLSDAFDNGDFPEYWSTYGDFSDFYEAVQAGDVDACSNAQEILQALNIGLATDLDTFKSWLRDVFDGNPLLAKTGIFIIWDEFTDYIRYNDLDIIQQLSLFSKEVPFFIIYVIHEYPGVFSENVSAGLGKADARFHKIDITLSEPTTLKLIGESIITRDGMKESWNDICDELYASISDNIFTFMGDPGSDIDSHTLKKIFPIHPMTVYLVSKVAGLAASNRSIFEFLKSSGDDGFRAYIHNNGKDEWRWVTLDYLWDYFFVNNLGGKKDLTKTAEDALKHYSKVKSQVNDERMLRVFKGAMLLLATVGSGHSLKKSRGSRGVQATENTLVDCFCGIMDKAEIEEYLQLLSSDPLNLLVLAPDLKEGFRIELPYSGMGGELEAEIEKIKKELTPSKLLSTGELIGGTLKKQFVPEEKAVVKRLVIETCWGSTQQINHKYGELKNNISKTRHKFGMLIVVTPSIEEIEKIRTTASVLVKEDELKRILIVILRQPFTEDLFSSLYDCFANANLSQKSGNPVNANSYNSQANEIIGSWVGSAIGKDMDLLYGETISNLHMNKAVIASYEKIVLTKYPAAPESIIKKITLYKSAALAPAYYGVTKTTLENKSASDDKQKNFNQQWQDCVDILCENEDVWGTETIEEVISKNETKVGRSMSSLCSSINKALTTGTVFLTDLWDSLQDELGYYDTSVCCYLLGFAMHYYVGKYTWFDGNNSHKLDEETIPTMIVSMVTGKATGMKLSSESDIVKRFKDITKRIFDLSADEIGDVYDCRKNVKIKINKNGYPIWALKYLDESEYNGIKDEIIPIIDKYVEYILEIGDQTDLLEEIVSKIKTNAKVYIQLLSSLLKDKAKSTYGMKRFVFDNSVEAKNVCEKFGFSVDVLFNMLSNTLEEERWQWKESEVIDATGRLALDLNLVGIVNTVLDGNAASVEKVKETLANYLGYMKVPGCIYTSLNTTWANTVEVLFDISINKWAGYSIEEKKNIITNLQNNMSDAIENITHPQFVLQKYIKKVGFGEFTTEEYEEILKSLPSEQYSQTEYSFKQNVKNIIRDLDYSKKVKMVAKFWKEKTGTKSVSSWMKDNIMPVSWVLPEYSSIFGVLYTIDNNERVDLTQLDNALNGIEKADLKMLSNKEEIRKCFIINVSSVKFISLLMPHIDEIKEYIQNSGCRDYYTWNTEIVKIREIVETYISNNLKEEVSEKAKKKINAIKNIDELRNEVKRLIEKSSEASLILLDEE